MTDRDEYGYSEEDITKNHGDPMWEAIWSVIRDWGIQRKPDAGYAGATGSDVQRIFDVIHTDVMLAQERHKRLMKQLEIHEDFLGPNARKLAEIALHGPFR